MLVLIFKYKSTIISAIPNSKARLGSMENLVSGAIEQINRNFYRAEYLKTNIGMELRNPIQR